MSEGCGIHLIAGKRVLFVSDELLNFKPFFGIEEKVKFLCVYLINSFLAQ